MTTVRESCRPNVPWAPQIPEDWDGGSLRWLSEIYAGGTPDRGNLDFWNDGTIPWLNSGAVNDWVITEPSELITNAGFKSSSARWVPAKSVVIGLAGQGKTKGTSARLEFEATTNQSMAAIVPGSRIDYRYLHYWLFSNYQSIRNLAGGDLRDGLNLQHLASIQVPLPPKDKQRAIADFLDRETARIDTLIDAQQLLIATLHNRQRALISHVTHTDDAVVVPLRRVAEVIDCAHVTAEFVDDDRRFPVASIRECAGPYVDLSSCKFTTETFFAHLRDSSRAPRTGDLLFVRNASVGAVAEVAAGTPEFALGQDTVLLRQRDTIRSSFLRYALATSEVRHAIAGAMIGSTFKRINVSAIRELPIPLPPITEQERIAADLSQALQKTAKLIAETERFIELAQERRAALITAAVTGQIDVRQEAA